MTMHAGDAYTEVEMSADIVMTSYGPVHTDPRLQDFDNMRCARCQAPIADVLAEDPDTGHERGRWITCFSGPLGLVCEDCAVDLDEVPLVFNGPYSFEDWRTRK